MVNQDAHDMFLVRQANQVLQDRSLLQSRQIQTDHATSQLDFLLILNNQAVQLVPVEDQEFPAKMLLLSLAGQDNPASPVQQSTFTKTRQVQMENLNQIQEYQAHLVYQALLAKMLLSIFPELNHKDHQKEDQASPLKSFNCQGLQDNPVSQAK